MLLIQFLRLFILFPVHRGYNGSMVVKVTDMNKRPLWKLYLVLAAVGLVAGVSLLYWQLSHPAPINRQTYVQAAQDFLQQLDHEGLVLARQVAPTTGGDAFLFIMTPENTGEISNAEVEMLTELIVYSASTFGNSGGLHADDISITFQAPISHIFILVSRPDGFPDPIGGISEFTLTDSEAGIGWSVINLQGPEKQLGREFTIDWATIQAVCLAYSAYQYENADPICNVISANAAAGWASIDRSAAESFLAGGSTGLEYLGSQDFEFRFIDFVYEEFSR